MALTLDEIKQKIQDIKTRLSSYSFQLGEQVTQSIIDGWELVTEDVEKVGYEAVKKQGEESMRAISDHEIVVKDRLNDYVANTSIPAVIAQENASKQVLSDWASHITTSEDGVVTAEREARILADQNLDNKINTEIAKVMPKSGGTFTGQIKTTSGINEVFRIDGLSGNNDYRDIMAYRTDNNNRVGGLRFWSNELTNEITIGCSDAKNSVPSGLGVIRELGDGTTGGYIRCTSVTPTVIKTDAKFNNANIATVGSLYAMLPSGIICMWSGAQNDIPAGWALCDGTNGTPDLRNKFIIGAGARYIVAETGGATQRTISSGVGNTTLTVDQIPSHTHDKGTYEITGTFTASDYGFTYSGAFYNNGGGNGIPNKSGGGATVGFKASSSWTGSSGYTGGTQSHTHTFSATVNTVPPYYALCFIMKL